MSLTVDNVACNQRVRIANFTGVTLDAHQSLDFAASEPEDALQVIRRHADLPYVYVVDARSEDRVPAVLSELRATRSPCYPYAVVSVGGALADAGDAELEVLEVAEADAAAIQQRVADFAAARLRFDRRRLRVGSEATVPRRTGVVIVGAGITGLYAAGQLHEAGIDCTVLEKSDQVGGIWSAYANTTSQVNTSECAYRLFDKPTRSNRDHSFTREVLEDLVTLANGVADRLYLGTEVTGIEKTDDGYRVTYARGGETQLVDCTGVLLAINDRVGPPRQITYDHQEIFRGRVVSGFSDDALDVDWAGKDVVVVGMGAFAVENVRTALEAGARHVTVVARRHGTICPKIIDYLNFTTPYDADYRHPNKSNVLNMMYWKKLYQLSGATEPECWMGEIKHDGHTISVSDIWFVAHHLGKLETVTGEITRLTETGVVVNGEQTIDADVVVNCIGFEKNSPVAGQLSGYTETYNNNYLDKDFMYLADAHIDGDAFNSLFGSSVLEMAKFYVDLYIRYYDRPDFDDMLATEGIERLPIDQRKWSDYIRAAMALVRRYPEIRAAAAELVTRRTQSFFEVHELETYIADNKREWLALHHQLAGRTLPEAECLPYVFERLLKKRRR